MLTLNNINKSFNKNSENEMALFKDFNFNVNQGEFIVIVGSNGSGKSTLLNLIDGSLRVDSGNINFNNQDITNLDDYLRRKDISRVYQDPQMGTSPSLTIRENMNLALNKGLKYNLSKGVNKDLDTKIKELLTLLNMNLENKLDSEVSLLSGGQRQALSLLMAISSKPKLLLLDEHTAALDPKASATIMELTNKLVNEFNITTVMITHQLKDAIDYGDRCVMFHLGDIVLDISGNKKKEIDPSKLVETFYQLTY